MVRRPRTRAWAVALAAALFAPSGARADNIAWNYAWTANPASLSATAGNGQITFLAQSGGITSSPGVAVGMLAAGVQFTSNASQSDPDRFSNVAETFTASVTDSSSGLSGSLTFAGVLNG